MSKIKCNAFVKRQTAASSFSYLADNNGRTCDWGTLEDYAEECMEHPAQMDATVTPGYKPGVIVLGVLPRWESRFQFYSGVVTLAEGVQVSARFAARRAGEEAFAEVLAHGAKTPAQAVDLILYSRELLIAEGEAVADGVDYEIVSINARTTIEPEPMTPVAMMRNMLALPGGTPATYTAEQFAASIRYWSCHAMHGGEP